MRRCLFAVAVAVLSSGQMCGVAPSPTAGNDAGAQGNKAVGIPQGLYWGQRTGTSKLDLLDDGVPAQESTITQPYSQAFGADGTLVGPDGSPTRVGYVRSNSVGNGTLEETVRSVTVGENSLLLVCDVTMSVELPGGTTATLVGAGQEMYTYQAPSVHYESYITMASVPIGGLIVSAEYRYSGTLSPLTAP